MRGGVRLFAAATVVLALLAGPGVAQELMADGNVGKFRVFFVLGGTMALADQDGRTLYTYERDEVGKSTCTGACAAEWPPVAAAPGDKNFESFSVFVREDGTRQWAFEGKPLYRYAKDSGTGQATGNAIDAAWYVVEILAHEM